MSDRQAYYLSTAKQLRAWKFLSALLVIPGAAFAFIYLQAELLVPSTSGISRAEATVVSKEATRIWGLVTRPELHLKVSGTDGTVFSVLMTLSEDDVPQTLQVVFSRAHPERVFVVGDYPYWPYSIAFAIGPLGFFLAARFFEAKYRHLAGAIVREET